MTYADAITLRDALEAALLSGAGARTVIVGDRTISYNSAADVRQALAEVNRSIAVYNRRSAGQNPNASRAKWT